MLHKIQKDFVALISGNDTQDTAFLADGGVRVSDRLSIYRDNVHAGLHNILCTAYPIVRRIVGDEFMALMTQRYIAANKPVNADMNQYGNSFADFIAHFSPAAELPYLPDMARFEWAQHCAYFAPDEDMCDPDALAALPEEAQNSLQLELKSCVYLIQSVWPLTHICDFAQAQNDSLTLDISTGGGAWLIARPALDVIHDTITPAQFHFFKFCEAGKDLQSATADTLALYQDFDLSQTLQCGFRYSIFKALPVNQ